MMIQVHKRIAKQNSVSAHSGTRMTIILWELVKAYAKDHIPVSYYNNGFISWLELSMRVWSWMPAEIRNVYFCSHYSRHWCTCTEVLTFRGSGKRLGWVIDIGCLTMHRTWGNNSKSIMDDMLGGIRSNIVTILASPYNGVRPFARVTVAATQVSIKKIRPTTCIKSYNRH